VTWIAAMVAGFIFIGVRRRWTGGSKHLTMLVAIASCLALAYSEVLR
jgi:hypothetical protein